MKLLLIVALSTILLILVLRNTKQKTTEKFINDREYNPLAEQTEFGIIVPTQGLEDKEDTLDMSRDVKILTLTGAEADKLVIIPGPSNNTKIVVEVSNLQMLNYKYSYHIPKNTGHQNIDTDSGAPSLDKRRPAGTTDVIQITNKQAFTGTNKQAFTGLSANELISVYSLIENNNNNITPYILVNCTLTFATQLLQIKYTDIVYNAKPKELTYDKIVYFHVHEKNTFFIVLQESNTGNKYQFIFSVTKKHPQNPIIIDGKQLGFDGPIHDLYFFKDNKKKECVHILNKQASS